MKKSCAISCALFTDGVYTSNTIRHHTSYCTPELVNYVIITALSQCPSQRDVLRHAPRSQCLTGLLVWRLHRFTYRSAATTR